MFKNVASQKVPLFAFNFSTGAPDTGDAANITGYVSKDGGTVTVLGTSTPTEMDSTNAKGWYLFTLAQAETNGDGLLFTGKSSTANIVLVGALIYTLPPLFTSLVVESGGLIDAQAVKAGPSGAGTALTARDIGASVNVSQINGVAALPRYTGTAQTGTNASITLQSATTALQCEVGDLIILTGGTGAGQSGYVNAFTGGGTGTPVASMVTSWPTSNPDPTTTYEIIKTGGLIPFVPGVVGGRVDANVGSVAAVNVQQQGSGTQNIGGP
jgi:hypothetical protein